MSKDKTTYMYTTCLANTIRGKEGVAREGCRGPECGCKGGKSYMSISKNGVKGKLRRATFEEFKEVTSKATLEAQSGNGKL